MMQIPNQLLPMSSDCFVTHVSGPPLSKDERFCSWFDKLTMSEMY